MEHRSLIKRNEPLIHAKTWLKLKNSTLRNRNQHGRYKPLVSLCTKKTRAWSLATEGGAVKVAAWVGGGCCGMGLGSS